MPSCLMWYSDSDSDSDSNSDSDSDSDSDDDGDDDDDDDKDIKALLYWMCAGAKQKTSKASSVLTTMFNDQ